MQPSLYRDFLIVLPRHWSSVKFLENILDYGAKGLQHTKSVTVSMQNDRLGAPSDTSDWEDDGLDLDHDGDWIQPPDGLGQLAYQPRVLNILMRFLINRMPIEQLETFR